MNNKFFFRGGDSGQWRVTSMSAFRGEPLEDVTHLQVVNGDLSPSASTWVLEGLTSNVRYATRAEAEVLAAIQPPLGRSEATCAALIPIKKSATWWALAQDERRAIFEEDSHHNAIGLEYLPAIARRLHHCRDIGGEFDFLTWFEFAPKHSVQFDELVARLRKRPEWEYVEREVDLRLERVACGVSVQTDGLRLLGDC